MKLKNLKEWMFFSEEEYRINQRFNIRGVDVQILSFTIGEDKNRLWVIYEQENSFGDELYSNLENRYEIITLTNREKRLNDIEYNNVDNSFFINEMEIQNQNITFNSSSFSNANVENIESIMNLQHFVEKKLIPNSWDDRRVKNLVIGQYRQSEDEKAPTIDKKKDLNIKLTTSPKAKEILIQHPFKARLGKRNKGDKVTYYDKELGKEYCVYINEIYSFDVYENLEKSMEKIEDLKMREATYSHLLDALENTYPRGKNLAVIKYETEHDRQLDFYMKDYLDAEITTSSASSAIGFLANIKEKGVNGYKLRECILQPIDKDFNGELEIELFSRYFDIPGETIK